MIVPYFLYLSVRKEAKQFARSTKQFIVEAVVNQYDTTRAALTNKQNK